MLSISNIKQDHLPLKDVFYALIGSLFIAFFSQVACYYPFSVVPFTFQAQAVFLLSAFLGRKKALLAVVAYLVEGVLGFPVFSMGKGSVAILLGFSGGYLFSYLPVSFFVGSFFDKEKRITFLKSFVVFSIANFVVLLLGFSFLAQFIGIKAAFLSGVYPFLITDLLKNILIAFIISSKSRFKHFLKRWV